MNILQKTTAIAYCILLCGITVQPMQAENIQPLRPREYHIGDRYYYLDSYSGRGGTGNRNSMYIEEVISTRVWNGTEYFAIASGTTYPFTPQNMRIRYERTDANGTYLFDTVQGREYAGYSYHVPAEGTEQPIPIPIPFNEIISSMNGDTTLFFGKVGSAGGLTPRGGVEPKVRVHYYVRLNPWAVIWYADTWGVLHIATGISPGISPGRDVTLRGAIVAGEIYGDTLRIPELPPQYISVDSLLEHGVIKDLTIGNQWFVEYISKVAIDTTVGKKQMQYIRDSVFSIEEAVRTEGVNGKIYTVIHSSHDGSERLERVDGMKLYVFENGEERLLADLSRNSHEFRDTVETKVYDGNQHWSWKSLLSDSLPALGSTIEFQPRDIYAKAGIYYGYGYSIENPFSNISSIDYITVYCTNIGMLFSNHQIWRKLDGYSTSLYDYRVKGCRLQGVLYGTQLPITSVAEKGAVGSNAALRIRVVPNPVAGGNAVTVQIQGGNEGHYDIELVSITGEVLYQHNGIMGNEGTGTAILPITEIASGRYIIRVRDSKGAVGSTTMIRTR